MEFPRPFEFLEVPNGESQSFVVKGFEIGTVRVFPINWETQIYQQLNRNQITAEQATFLKQNGKEVPCMRILVATGYKDTGAPYWDVTSQTLIEQLKPYLNDPAFRGRKFTVTAVGERPQKRYKLEVSER